MRFQTTDNPDRLILRYSLGCATVVLLLFGAITTACVFIPAEVRGGDEIPWYIGLPVGLGLLVGGTYRKRITLDRGLGQVETCKSVAGYVYRRSPQMLKRFDRIILQTRIRKSDNSRYVAYYVSLAGSATVGLEERQDADSARRTAERVARFLSLPLHDDSSGKVIVREADVIGASVRETVSQGGERTSPPLPPQDILTEVDISQEPTVVLRVPPAGWSFRLLLTFLPMCGFGAFFIWLVHDVFATDPDVAEIAIAAIAFSVGALLIFGSLAYVIVSCTRRVTVTASYDQVTIESTSLLGRWKRVLNANDIEDVIVSQPLTPGRSRNAETPFRGGVTIRNCQKTIVFGGHLPKAEQNFLSQFLRSVLEG